MSSGSFGKSKSSHVPNWLDAKYTLKSLNDESIESCFNQIVKLFNNGKKDIILLLLGTTQPTITRKIRKILKTVQRDMCENDINATNSNIFDNLPIESINHIGSFLNKTDIYQFKMVSISIALIVFNIMKCYQVNVFNMNELIKINEYKYLQHTNLQNKLKINRVQPFIKYRCLIDIYSNKYNISNQNILTLKTNQFKLNNDMHSSKNVGTNSCQKMHVINSSVYGIVLENTFDIDTKIQN
eukprot:370381_1